MPFNLTLSFTGIEAFVQLNEGSPIWVVMPGLDSPKDALDGEALCPHTSYIETTGRNVPPGVDFKRTLLKGQVVTFGLTYASPPTSAPTYLPKELIDMQVLLGDLCVINEAVVAQTSPPRPAYVMTQVRLPPGEFSSWAENGWSVDQVDPDHGAPLPGPLAHDVTLTIRNLTDADAILTAMDGSGTRTLNLRPDDEATTVNVLLVNTCKELADPVGSSVRDRDFKWYFELLDDNLRAEIVRLLVNDDLPIPLYTPPPNSFGVRLESPLVVVVGGSHDCFPVQMAGNSYVSSVRAKKQDRRK